MARMLSRVHPSFCPVCRRGPAGPDCPDDGVDKRTQRVREKRAWRREADWAGRLGSTFASANDRL